MASSSCSMVGGAEPFGQLRISAYTDMTKPGVQKPHCDPWARLRRSWTGWSPPRTSPMPSTVTTWQPSTAYSGYRQAFTARCSSAPEPGAACGSGPDTITVHAPQPPSPQPSLVPVRPSARSHESSVASPRPRGRACRFPFTYAIISGPAPASWPPEPILLAAPWCARRPPP